MSLYWYIYVLYSFAHIIQVAWGDHKLCLFDSPLLQNFVKSR